MQAGYKFPYAVQNGGNVSIEAQGTAFCGNMPDVSPVGYIHTEVRKEASNEIARQNREVPGQGGYYKEIALRSEVWRGKLDQCAKRRLSQIARADGQPRVLDHGMRYAEAPARGLVSARKQGACIYCTRNGHRFPCAPLSSGS